MTPLSTPASPPEDADSGRRPRPSLADTLLFVVAPIGLGFVFLAVLLAERTEIGGDLQIVSPPAARPGGSVAVRGFHFRDLDRPEGPELVDLPGRVELRSADGRAVSSARFERSASLGLEAVVPVPSDAAGPLTLVAAAPLGPDRDSTVRAPVEIARAPRPLEARGRLSVPLQRYAAFPVRPEQGATAPRHLDLRVVGGACVPEVPCELLVLVGEPAAAVSIEPSAMVTPEPPDGGETAGIVRLRVVTHGPEAEVELLARRADALVARRTIRLPIALASFALRLGSALPSTPAAPPLSFEGVESGRAVIVDAFRTGAWERTGSVAADRVGGRPVTPPFDPLAPGLWRLQARTDPFSTDSAATRLLYVRSEGETAADAAAAVAREAAAWHDPQASTVAAMQGDPEARASFLLALPETDLIPQPMAMSGQMQAATGLDDRRVTLRWAAAVAFVLAGLLVAVVVMRRGLAAGAEARAILTAAGDESADTPQQRRRMTLSLLAAVLALALAFVAAAALILARSGL